jgi:hypothetical protein
MTREIRRLVHRRLPGGRRPAAIPAARVRPAPSVALKSFGLLAFGSPTTVDGRYLTENTPTTCLGR